MSNSVIYAGKVGQYSLDSPNYIVWIGHKVAKCVINNTISHEKALKYVFIVIANNIVQILVQCVHGACKSICLIF